MHKNVYRIYSNRGRPQIEDDSNASRNVRASSSGQNDSNRSRGKFGFRIIEDRHLFE